MIIPKRIIEKAAKAVSPHLFTDVFEQTLNKMSLFTPEQARESTEKKRAEALQRVTDVLTPVYADIQADALREAAFLLYTDAGPGHMLSTATWLHARADELDGRKTM